MIEPGSNKTSQKALLVALDESLGNKVLAKCDFGLDFGINNGVSGLR